MSTFCHFTITKSTNTNETKSVGVFVLVVVDGCCYHFQFKNKQIRIRYFRYYTYIRRWCRIRIIWKWWFTIKRILRFSDQYLFAISVIVIWVCFSLRISSSTLYTSISEMLTERILLNNMITLNDERFKEYERIIYLTRRYTDFYRYYYSL